MSNLPDASYGLEEIKDTETLLSQLIMVTDGRDPKSVSWAARALINRGGDELIKKEHLTTLRHEAYKFKTMQEQVVGSLTTLVNTINDALEELESCKQTVLSLQKKIIGNVIDNVETKP